MNAPSLTADPFPCQRERSAWAVLIALLGLAVLAIPFFLRHVYTADDLGAYHLPLRDFYARQLAAGESFDWMPSLFHGYYVTGEGQLGSYHPLHYLLYRYLSLPVAFDWELLLNYPLLFGGMTLWLRRELGRTDAALVGGLTFTLSGFNLLHFVHPNAVAIIAHLPWLLWAIHAALRASTPARRHWAQAAIGLLTGSQLLLGYPQYVWLSLLAEACYALWLVRKSESSWSGLFGLVPAKLLGLLVGGVQLLPTIEALGQSNRGQLDEAFFQTGSLHPLNLVQFVAPYLFQTRVVGQNTHELGLYCGSATILLAVWLWKQRASWGTLRPLIQAALVGLGLALLLAAGEYGGLTWLQRKLPLVGSFRFPCRAIVLVHLFLSICSAAAVALLATTKRTEPTSLREPLVLSLLVAIVAPFAWPDHIAAAPAILAGPAVIVVAWLVVRQLERGRAWAWPALLALITIDQLAYGCSQSILAEHAPLDTYVAQTEIPGPGARVYLGTDQGQQIGNRILLAGASRIDGYAGLEPLQQNDPRDPQVQALAGANWSWDRDHWLPVAATPRFRLAEAVSDSAVTVNHDRPGAIAVQVTTPSPTLLLTGESFHPGWQVTIDGFSAEPLPVERDFLGCAVPAGEHQVQLTFLPASLGYGWGASFLGLGLLICRLGFQTVRSL